MAIDYPDIINEYIDARKRYETDGVQVFPIWSQLRSQWVGLPISFYSFRARSTFHSKSP